MTTKFKTYLIIFSVAILTPYIMTIFFSQTNMLIILPILFFSLVALIITTIRITEADQKKSRKKYYWITAIMAIVLFFVSYNLQNRAANRIYFELRKNKLTVFVSELKKYDKIKEMSNGQRYYKTLNSTFFETNSADVDTTDKTYFLDDILKRDRIDKEKYEFFRNILVETNQISFTTLEDGTVLFTTDGFLDKRYGIAYSEITRNNDGGEKLKEIGIFGW